MSDFDIGFLLFYVFVGVVMIPIAYMLDKRRKEEAIKRALRFHEMRHFESRKFNVRCDYLLNPAVLEKKGDE